MPKVCPHLSVTPPVYTPKTRVCQRELQEKRSIFCSIDGASGKQKCVCNMKIFKLFLCIGVHGFGLMAWIVAFNFHLYTHLNFCCTFSCYLLLTNRDLKRKYSCSYIDIATAIFTPVIRVCQQEITGKCATEIIYSCSYTDIEESG
jgi:hypothetical protein